MAILIFGNPTATKQSAKFPANSTTPIITICKIDDTKTKSNRRFVFNKAAAKALNLKDSEIFKTFDDKGNIVIALKNETLAKKYTFKYMKVGSNLAFADKPFHEELLAKFQFNTKEDCYLELEKVPVENDEVAENQVEAYVIKGLIENPNPEEGNENTDEEETNNLATDVLEQVREQVGENVGEGVEVEVESAEEEADDDSSEPLDI